MILLRQKIFMLGTYVKGADGKYVKTGDVAGGGGYSLTGGGGIIQGSGDKGKDRVAKSTPSILGAGQLSSGPIKSPVGLGKSGVNSNTVANTLKNASSNNANIISQQTQRTNERNVIKNNPELSKAIGQYKSGQNSKPTTPTQQGGGSILNTVKNEASNNWNAIKQGATGTWNNMSKAGKIATGALAIGGTMMIANNIRRRRQAEEEARMARRYGRY